MIELIDTKETVNTELLKNIVEKPYGVNILNLDLNFDVMTVDDLIDAYKYKGYRSVIVNGKLIGFTDN